MAVDASRAVADAEKAGAQQYAPYEYWGAVTYLEQSKVLSVISGPGGFLTPNESRALLNYPPIEGGDKLGPLNGPLLTEPNGTYEVTFGPTLPAGDYKFTCTPHMAMGMKGKVTVQK